MTRSTRLLAAAMLIALVAAGCGKEKRTSRRSRNRLRSRSIPGSRYLAQLTDLWKQARKVIESERRHSADRDLRHRRAAR